MKRFLKKKWHRIPVGIVSVILALVLVAGGVLAAYPFATVGIQVEVEEAIYMSIGETDDIPTYGSGVLPLITMTSPGAGQLDIDIEEDVNVDASEFTAGEWIVIPVNVRNRSDASFTLAASWFGGGGNVVLEYQWQTNTSGGTDFKPTGSWADLSGWNPTLAGHAGQFGSADVGALVLFVRIRAIQDAAPATYNLTVQLTRA